MDKDLLTAFPLLIPRNAEFTGFDGYISVGKEDVLISIELPANRDLSHARIQGQWQLQHCLRGKQDIIKQKLKQCSSLKTFLLELQNILAEEFRSQHYEMTEQFIPSYSLELIKEIEQIGWDKISSIDESFNGLSLRHVDPVGREHIIKLEFCSKYPVDPPKCTADLPVQFTLQWSNKSSLNDIYQQLVKQVSMYQDFWNVMDDIDGKTWVLDPEKPNRRDTIRRIAISTCVSVQLLVDPVHPYAVPECYFLGSDQAISPLRQKFNSKLDEWDFEILPLLNIERALEITFPSRQDTNREDFVVACSICYAYKLNDSIPNKTCDDTRCQQQFHTECLYEWLKVLPSTRQSFNVIFGECPYCSKPISCKVPSTR